MKSSELFSVDPRIAAFEKQVYDTPLIKDAVWKDKYLQASIGETHPYHAYGRVAEAIAHSPVETDHATATTEFFEVMSRRLFLPGGRILAGAGTSKRVTLMNCYVNGTLEDSIEGISEGKKRLMITSSMGGGMGTDFSPLRPLNALIGKLGTGSSGAVSFMDTFNADGKTIRSAGERRAAQMGMLIDTHPDLPDFIRSKGDGLRDGTERLKEFNVSVMISDAFKAAVDDDEEWPLYFHIPPRYERQADLIERDFEDDNGVKQYVYSIWKARDLWNLITEYTYEFSDPGIFFIDRVNSLNNLSYCEYISCTNPCGEQPLPPNGTCNLGAVNVANVVVNPFTDKADINWELLARVARVGVRFLDNVINVTNYPLKEQEQEEFNKRRIGLGILGLGTMFAEMKVRYGSLESVQLARRVMKTICIAAYEESVRLADLRGSFPFYKDEIVDCGFIAQKLDEDLKTQILEIGLRNGVILTIAPVGTGAIAFGNVSSGLEPDYAHEVVRRVRQANSEEFKEYVEKSYTKRFYEFCTGKTDTPDYMVTAEQLTILEHIKVQAALQEWVDSSTSKTINVPQDITIEEFREVYELAYQYGLKGTTTYRHSKWRESILKAATQTKEESPKNHKRPSVLKGSTYKLKWPSMNSSMFVTINYRDERPYEIFFASKDAKYSEWMTALTLMISNIMRNQDHPESIINELKQVVSAHDAQWSNGKFTPSLVAKIAHTIEEDFISNGIIEAPEELIKESDLVARQAGGKKDVGEICPSCRAPTLTMQEGCKKCVSCGYSAC